MSNFEKYYGKTILNAYIEENALFITFSDASKIKIYDGCSQCCEIRYMSCDDLPSILAGGKLLSIDVSEIENRGSHGYHEVHDVCFVKIVTNKFHITLTTHNVHNGYYGGFDLQVSEVREDV